MLYEQIDLLYGLIAGCISPGRPSDFWLSKRSGGAQNPGAAQLTSGWAVVEPLVTKLFGAVRVQQLAAGWPLPPATK
jgi:hypothetical protein